MNHLGFWGCYLLKYFCPHLGKCPPSFSFIFPFFSFVPHYKTRKGFLISFVKCIFMWAIYSLVPHSGLELTVQSSLALTSQKSHCLNFPRPGFKSMSHHFWGKQWQNPKNFFWKEVSNLKGLCQIGRPTCRRSYRQHIVKNKRTIARMWTGRLAYLRMQWMQHWEL